MDAKTKTKILIDSLRAYDFNPIYLDSSKISFTIRELDCNVFVSDVMFEIYFKGEGGPEMLFSGSAALMYILIHSYSYRKEKINNVFASKD